MAELKTRQNNMDVDKFLNSIDDPTKKSDRFKIKKLMEDITGEKGKMWGESIIGFGSYRYKYKSGREGEWFLTGFSPRKQNLTFYVMSYIDNDSPILRALGKYKMGKACLYINKLENINMDKLRELIQLSVDKIRNK